MRSNATLVIGFVAVFVGAVFSYNRIANSSRFVDIGGDRFPKNLNLFNVIRLMFSGGPPETRSLYKRLFWIGVLHWLAMIAGFLAILIAVTLLNQAEAPE